MASAKRQLQAGWQTAGWSDTQRPPAG